MNSLIRYSLSNDLRIQYFDGKVSVWPQKNTFSMDLKAGHVTTDIPRDELKQLNENSCELLADNSHYRDAFEVLQYSTPKHEYTDIHVNISINVRFCNMYFSNGVSSFYSQKVGRMAICEKGLIKYRDFALSDNHAAFCEILQNTYDDLMNQFREPNSMRTLPPEKLEGIVYILSPQAAAFFTHEVIGHIFEQDNWELTNNKIHPGQTVLPSCCNIVDDPLKSSYFKYGDYDDAGNKTRRSTIIKSGCFNECITLCRSAEYSQVPMPRMSNICLLSNPNGRSFSKMCTAYERYIVIEEISNGGLIPETGDFFVSCTKQYFVDSSGEKHNIFPTTYIGTVKELNKSIIEIGNDMMNFMGVCSKNRQNIFVSNSAPSIVASGLTVMK